MSMTFTPPKASEIERAASLAFFAAKEQMLSDCNFFAKYDQGVMKNGSYATAEGMSVSCHWDAPYAGYAWYKADRHTPGHTSCGANMPPTPTVDNGAKSYRKG